MAALTKKQKELLARTPTTLASLPEDVPLWSNTLTALERKGHVTVYRSGTTSYWQRNENDDTAD